MKKFVVAAGASALFAASPAHAIAFLFTPGAPSPSAGFTVVANFDNGTLSGFTTTTPSLVQVKTPPADSSGAPPANSVPANTPYLSVLGGGSASYNFASPVSAFQFDWGSIDTYNTVTIRIQGQASDFVVPGTDFITPANGNQISPGTNGLLTVLGTSGELFTGITLTSSSNSFEFDNLAVGSVPEPATWGLMLAGFAMVGAGLRGRRRRTTVTYA